MNIYGIGRSAYVGTTPSATSKGETATKSTQEAQPQPKTDTFTLSANYPSQQESETKTNALSSEQIAALKAQVKESMVNLAKKMLGDQVQIATLANGSVDYEGLAQQLGMGTTPESAQAAIAPGGMWSVDAVSTRLMDMAIQLSNGDASMASELRAAVEKGFEAAGGLENLPQVCQDTYHETMKRFDYWEEHGSMEGYGSSTAETEE